MRYLYINTCANTAVAWVDTQAGEATVAEASDSRSQVEELSALVDQVRGGESGVEDARPDFVVVSRGPAPFTGLRVGLVTARTLAMAWGVPVFGVDELELLAQAGAFFVPELPTWVVSLTDARRREVYGAPFEVRCEEDGDSLVMCLERRAADWVGQAGQYGDVLAQDCARWPGFDSEEVLVTGNGATQIDSPWQAQAPLEMQAQVAGAMVCQALRLAGLSQITAQQLVQTVADKTETDLQQLGLGTEPQYLRRPDIQEKKARD